MKTLPLSLLLAVVGGFFIGCQPSAKEELRTKSDERYLPRVGQPSPPFKFMALDGREVDLEKLRGKVVLLDFWATWCPPCIEEIPNVRAAYERYQKDGFEIVGISFDADRQRLEEVVKREKLPWPQFFDGGGRDAAPGKTFGIQHWPSMWLLDRNGVIRYISAGAGLDRKIAALLKESANPITAARGVFEQKAALDRSGDGPATPAVASGGPIAPPGSPQDPAYLHWLGKPFPPLKFKAIDGREVDTDKLRGRVLLIDFWATWCPPCMAEIPNLKAVYERFNQQGFEIIGVSADETRGDLERVVREKALKWPQHFEGRSGEVPNLRRYGVQHFPTMWLVDRQGIIRDVTGMVALNDKVARLINENNAPTPTKHNPVAAPAPSARPEPTTSPAPAPPPRPQPSKLGDHTVSVKNITITAKRSTALLQVGPTTYTVSTGTELVFPSGTEKIVARCIAIERSAVVLAVDGQTDPVRLVLP